MKKERNRDGEYIPDFDNQGNLKNEKLKKYIKKYKETVVVALIEYGLHEETSKTSEAPYFNNMEQSLNSHILPGIDIILRIINQCESLDDNDFKILASYWTIHDIHKISDIKEKTDSEFDISEKTVKGWVQNLRLDEYCDELSVEDYHACAVGLHNSSKSNQYDSTTNFSKYRKYLKLVDAIVSEESPTSFYNNCSKEVNAVFGSSDEVYETGMQEIKIKDSILCSILNKVLYEKLDVRGYKILDIRNNGILYAKSSRVKDPEWEEFIPNLVSEFKNNIRNVYQIYRNHGFLSGSIGGKSLSSKGSYKSILNKYNISNLDKLCLENNEIIIRLVQATIDQQNKPYNISNDARDNIKEASKKVGIEINKNAYIESYAALTQTFYDEIIPYLINENGKLNERSREHALIHIFNIRNEWQKYICEIIEEASTYERSQILKYIVADDIDKQLSKYSSDEKHRILSQRILDRLSDFEKWEDFGLDNADEIDFEISKQIYKNVYIDGKKLSNYSNKHINEKTDGEFDERTCIVCSNKTIQPEKYPRFISYRDNSILNMEFTTKQKNNKCFEDICVKDRYKRESICLFCQLSFSIRAQQFNTYYADEDEETWNDYKNKLFLKVNPNNSKYENSSLLFNYIRNKLQIEISDDSSNICNIDIPTLYSDAIQNVYKDDSLGSFENKIVEPTIRFDESMSLVSLDEDTETAKLKSALCAAIAATITGQQVCITEKPPYRVNCQDEPKLIITGDDMISIGNIISEDSTIENLPNKIQLLKKMIEFGSKIDLTDEVIKKFVMNYGEYKLPGSEIYNELYNESSKVHYNQVDAVRLAYTIDALYRDNTDIPDIVQHRLSDINNCLVDLLQTKDVTKARAMIQLAVETVIENKENSKEEIRDEIIHAYLESDTMYIDSSDILPTKNGKAYELASILSKINEDGPIEEYKNALISGTIVRFIGATR